MWSVFRKTESGSAICCLCRDEIKWCGRTSNLHYHMRKHHKEFYDDGDNCSNEVGNTIDLSDTCESQMGSLPSCSSGTVLH